MPSSCAYPQPNLSFTRALPNGDVEIEKYLALWGSETKRDCYDTWFDKDNPPNLGLDLLPVALMFEHNEAGSLSTARIGKVISAWFDDKGVKFRAVLDHTAPLFKQALKLIEDKKAFVSSGSAEHLARFDAAGRFVDWLLTEVSLTQTPCETRMPSVDIVRHNKGAVRADGLNGAMFSVRCAPVGKPCNCGCSKSDNSKRGEYMPATLESLGLAGLGIDQIANALIEQFGADLVATVYNNVFAAENAPIDDVAALQAAAASAYPEVDNSALTALVDILYAVIHEMPDSVAALVSALSAPAAESPETMSAPENPVLAQIQRKARQLPKAKRAAPANTALEQLQEEVAAMRRQMTQRPLPQATPAPVLPDTRRAPFHNQLSDKFDSVSTEEMAAGYEWLRKLKKKGYGEGPSQEYRATLAARIEDEATSNPAIRKAFKRSGYQSTRANELMGSTVASAGDEWVGVFYDNNLWEKVRQNVMYQELVRLGMVEREVPQGSESVVIPTEGADPTWYVVGQSVSEDGNGRALTKLDSSKPGTSSKSLTVAKLGAAVTFTGELDEDSVIPMLPDLNRRMETSAMEQIEYILINGDTATGANTNINLIDGTPTAATLGGMPSYTLLNGFLKLALVTNTANSFDMSGAPVSTDFLDLLKRMGTNGRDGLSDKRQLFIVDNLSYAAVLAAIAADTNGEVWAQASPYITGERDMIWGRPMYSSGQMALANSAGKIPNAGGTLGRLLAVRPDRWVLGWKRRLTTEVERDARSDTTLIVSYMRMGLVSFDNEASAVAYNGTV